MFPALGNSTTDWRLFKIRYRSIAASTITVSILWVLFKSFKKNAGWKMKGRGGRERKAEEHEE